MQRLLNVLTENIGQKFEAVIWIAGAASLLCFGASSASALSVGTMKSTLAKP